MHCIYLHALLAPFEDLSLIVQSPIFFLTLVTFGSQVVDL